MSLTSFRNNLVFFIIGCYLLFNYGFMQLRLPIGNAGIPIGEIVLFFVLATIHYPTTLPRLNQMISVNLLFLWWGYIFLRTLPGLPKYGFWAFRDASNVIESLFILVGFSFLQRTEYFEKIFKWMPKLLFIGVLYGMTYPFAYILQPLSPKIISGSGQSVPIFFTYVSTALVMILSAFYLLLFSKQKEEILYNSIAFLLITFTILQLHARTIYLQLIAAFIFLSVYRKNFIKKGFTSLIVCIGFLILMPLLDITLYGKFGKMSVEFLFNHFIAIGGIESEGLEGSAQGVGLRLGWWYYLFSRLTENLQNFLFGLGYGFSLIDFTVTGGVEIREPHNSYISIFSRSGLIGISLFTAVHFYLIKTWFLAHRLCRMINWQEGLNWLLLIFVYFILVWVFAIGEDAFEKPFNAIPYYFFWGIVLRFYYHLKNNNIGPLKTNDENPART